MPKLRRLSGKEVIRIFEHFGFVVVAQKGSHVKLGRTGPGDVRQILIVPMHSQLDTGTCRAILRQATRFISESDLRPFFFTE